jgi:hypothetical protein
MLLPEHIDSKGFSMLTIESMVQKKMSISDACSAIQQERESFYMNHQEIGTSSMKTLDTTQPMDILNAFQLGFTLFRLADGIIGFTPHECELPDPPHWQYYCKVNDYAMLVGKEYYQFDLSVHSHKSVHEYHRQIANRWKRLYL